MKSKKTYTAPELEITPFYDSDVTEVEIIMLSNGELILGETTP